MTEEVKVTEGEPQNVEELKQLPAKVDDTSTKVEEEKKEALVPHGALHEERERRKKYQQEVEQEKRARDQERAVFNDRLAQLYQVTQGQKQQENLPDPNDPVAVHDHAIRQQQEQIHRVTQRLQWEDAQRAQQQNQQQLVNWASAKASEFIAETPDYQDAYKHMVSLRANEYKAMGMGPQDVQRAIINDEMNVSAHAYQTGKNPAEIIYAMAKSTGYAGKQAQGEQKIDALNKGAQASKALSNGASSGAPTAEQIAAMSDEDFAKFKTSLKGKPLSEAL